jgi:hypothetical protein
VYPNFYNQAQWDALHALGLYKTGTEQISTPYSNNQQNKRLRPLSQPPHKKTAGYADLARHPATMLAREVGMSAALGAGGGALMDSDNRLENSLRGATIGGAMGLSAHGLRRLGRGLSTTATNPNALVAGKDLRSVADLAPWFAPVAGGFTAKKKESKA